MSEFLRSTLHDIAREAVPSPGLADDVLRLAGRRRARRRVLVPAAAMAAIVAVVLAVTNLAQAPRSGVVPANPVTGPGSVPSHVSAPKGAVRSVFTAPIWRAALMYHDRSGTPILLSADSDEVRSLPVHSSGGYSGKAYSLSPDGTKVAYGWVGDGVAAIKRMPSPAQLRIVTLATGRTETLPLPGRGHGEIVDHITWSADSTRLLVQANVVDEVVDNGWGGKAECFVVDAGTGARIGDVDFRGSFLGGWSADGTRLLSVAEAQWQVVDTAGNVVRNIPVSDESDTAPYATFGGGFNWSPDEKIGVLAVGKGLPGHPLNLYDGSSRPFLLRVVSLESSDSNGNAAEIDVPLGSAQLAYVVGWRDSTHALVALWPDGGAQRVDSVDVHSGVVTPAVRLDAGISTGPVAIAADVASAGGFR